MRLLLNKDRAYKIMDKYGLDALIGSTEGNIAYLSDYWPLGTFRPMGHQAFCILPRDPGVPPALIIPTGDLAAWVKRRSWIEECHPYGTFYLERSGCLKGDERLLDEREVEIRRKYPFFGDSVQTLLSVLREKRLDAARLGLDEANVPAQTIEAIRKALPSARIDYAYDVLREIRAVKTEEEIRRIRESTRITESAIEETLACIREGVTERELVNICRAAIGRHGGVPVLWFIGGGTGSSMIDRDPSDYALRKGDWVMLDIACTYEHYYSDIARSVVLGEPSAKQVEYYSAIQKGRQECIDMIKPGVRVKDIFEKGISSIHDAGLRHFRRHHIGHSTGIEPYDPPVIEPTSEWVLEENMVIIVETPYYELGFGAIQLEDTLLVTATGHEFISKLPQDLRSIK
jgi:Xaa-Pro dipeptidase